MVLPYPNFSTTAASTNYWSSVLDRRANLSTSDSCRIDYDLVKRGAFCCLLLLQILCQCVRHCFACCQSKYATDAIGGAADPLCNCRFRYPLSQDIALFPLDYFLFAMLTDYCGMASLPTFNGVALSSFRNFVVLVVVIATLGASGFWNRLLHSPRLRYCERRGGVLPNNAILLCCSSSLYYYYFSFCAIERLLRILSLQDSSPNLSHLSPSNKFRVFTKSTYSRLYHLIRRARRMSYSVVAGDKNYLTLVLRHVFFALTCLLSTFTKRRLLRWNQFVDDLCSNTSHKRLVFAILTLFMVSKCARAQERTSPDLGSSYINPDSYDSHSIKHFTNTFFVKLHPTAESHHHRAKRFAEDHGFIPMHSFSDGQGHVMRHEGIEEKSNKPFHQRGTFNYSCLTSPDIISIEQQVAKNRIKRDTNYNDPDFPRSTFNDPRYPQQWYLHRGRGMDLNTIEAWRMGYTGKGVVISILDDGIEKDNPDLVGNYDPEASYDINDQDSDPQPRYDLTNENRHGTRCAGEVAAVANNSICIVGVAFRSRIGGVRMLDGDVTDAVEAQALSLNPDHIDIYSASWGPDDDGKTLDGPANLAQKAFEDGVRMGRRGLGSIFAWASGNGGRDKDNCNCDGYTNSIYTLSISSATESGYVPWYSETCSSTLATTYSSGSVMENKIISTDLRHGCTDSHTGTSASAPLAAGILALALEANPNLNWRDMQHLVIRTSRPDYLHAEDWVTNGVGRKVSHSFGYGMMDAGAMVRMARTWRSVPSANNCTVTNTRQSGPIPPAGSIRFTIETDGCLGLSGYNYVPTRYGNSDFGATGVGTYTYGGHVKYLEHVQARITLKAPERGQIEIYLTSPAGTKSKLLFKRPKDFSGAGINNWPFMTTHNWGELSYGTWTLEITNGATLPGYLVEWSLTIYGTETQPESFGMASGARGLHENLVLKQGAISTESSLLNCFKMLYPGHCLVCEDSYALYEGMCLKQCPPNLYKALIMAPLSFSTNEATIGGEGGDSTSQSSMVKKIFSLVCKSCHASCKRCKGGGPGDCTSCHDGFYLVPSTPHSMSPSLASWTTKAFVSCRPCHVTCGNCRGPSRIQCTSCHRQSPLGPSPVLVKNRCIIPTHAHVRSQNDDVNALNQNGNYPTSVLSKYRVLVLSVLGMVLISFFMALFLVTKNIHSRRTPRNTKKLHVVENFCDNPETLSLNGDNAVSGDAGPSAIDYETIPKIAIFGRIFKSLKNHMQINTQHNITEGNRMGTINESFSLKDLKETPKASYKLVNQMPPLYDSCDFDENDSDESPEGGVNVAIYKLPVVPNTNASEVEKSETIRLLHTF